VRADEIREEHHCRVHWVYCCDGPMFLCALSEVLQTS
jgi:hypothetical protein